MLRGILRNEDVVLSPDDEKAGAEVTLESLINNLSFVRAGEHVSEEQRRLYKLSVFYIMFVLCAEVGLNNEVIKKFWAQVGIERTVDRILYAVQKWETLVYRGPFIEMALMTRIESERKFSRGVFFDGLHAIYLPYVSLFLTNDEHFLGLREYLQGHPNALKIAGMEELEFVYHDRENPDPGSFIKS